MSQALTAGYDDNLGPSTVDPGRARHPAVLDSAEKKTVAKYPRPTQQRPITSYDGSTEVHETIQTLRDVEQGWNMIVGGECKSWTYEAELDERESEHDIDKEEEDVQVRYEEGDDGDVNNLGFYFIPRVVLSEDAVWIDHFNYSRKGSLKLSVEWTF